MLGPRTRGGMALRNDKARLFFLAVVLPIVLFCLGVGELWRCLRTLLPATSISYRQASAEGLSGRGYVRLTEVNPGVKRAVVVDLIKRDADRQVVDRHMDSAFVPAEPAGDDAAAQGRYRVLIWVPQARSVEEAGDLLRGAMPAEGELLCFVECPFPELNPGYHQFIKHLAGARGENCWVVKIWRPSWKKGLGLTLAAVLIPGLIAVWQIRKPW